MKQFPRQTLKASGSSKTDSVEIPSTRWWESYLVRYFIGFIVGCVCVIIFGLQTGLFEVLFKHLPSFDNKTGKPDWSAITLLVSLLGIGFCYIASTPITVLHTGRYRRGWLDGHSRHFWLAWSLLTFFVLIGGSGQLGNKIFLEWMAIVLSSIFLYAATINKENPIDKQYPKFAFFFFIIVWLFFLWGIAGRFLGAYGHNLSEDAQEWWVISMPVFWIFVGQYAVLFRIIHEKEQIFIFYAKIFKARRMKNARDIRDTYTHLREHSNSVFIVVVELALLALFMAITKSFHATQEGAIVREKLGLFVVFGLFLWMIPTVFMWARANSLEAEFAENPDVYIK